MKNKFNDKLLELATKAFRGELRKIKAERKLRNQPMIVWRDGKVLKVKE